MINLDWLQTFCALVETGHFTRTAEKLAMTQPGVSQQIRKLEAHFGHPLLLREGKKFSLTDAGERVYHQARRSLADLNQLEHSLSNDNPHQGRCRVATPGSLGLKLYPQLIALQQRHPQLTIEHRIAPNDSIERDLTERRLDLGLITRPSDLPDLRCEPIAQEALQLILPGASPNRPDWEHLHQLGFINHPDGAHHARQLLGANYPEFDQIDQLPQHGFCNQIGMILTPVAAGLGFTVLPAHAVAAFDQQDKLQIATLANPIAETIYLIQRRYQPQPKRIGLLLHTINSALH
ncbi:LysR family transcriptional regulator [Ferrimonas pelagia]|uniref:LysR family transcriptional regulator n=1 Tax=Ferrimonas pelagia TaxID=1177826 RepID=A0ABP9EML2_9GAMM